MKKWISQLNELQRMLLLGGIVMLFLCLLSLIPLFVFNQTGWLIGVSIGSTVGIINILLTYKGSEVGLKTYKTFYFMLFYFVRILLILLSFLLTALFQFGFIVGENVFFSPISAFDFSLWGDLIGVLPMQIVLVIVMMKEKKNPITISENLNKDEK
ncbi:MAG TPA: hypothetical protein DDW20_00425 [Firmicutes bacterium]|nr:hypothetical protein [Bacillota bacterium]